ncbi:MAG: hypothetical protein HKM95_17410 [Inquilinus sp.]|nr:hypothetical protein [Inquilinus sp.]
MTVIASERLVRPGPGVVARIWPGIEAIGWDNRLQIEGKTARSGGKPRKIGAFQSSASSKLGFDPGAGRAKDAAVSAKNRGGQNDGEEDQ